jgi:sulfur carrier protein ThiS
VEPEHRGIIQPRYSDKEVPLPAIIVGLPAALTAPHPPRDYACEAATVGEALEEIVRQAPQYEPRIFYGERLLVVVTLNGKHVPPGQARAHVLEEGDRVDVLLPVAGG